MDHKKSAEHQYLQEARIRENSWIAKAAARKMKTQNMAIVLGKTIHLYNASRQDLLQNRKWLKHELCHVRQFKQHGYLSFVIRYLWETIKNGYHNNRYEVAARQAEDL